jgi:NAD(P)-dependent dehydrogenase (short-subunit alcohol dehydrogenase family)
MRHRAASGDLLKPRPQRRFFRRENDMDIKGHTAIVTGGASGLGGATARRIAAAGGKVAIFDFNEELAKQTADKIGGKAYVVDVTDSAKVQEQVEAVAADLGDIRACINCAGTGIAVRTVSKNGPHNIDAYRKIIEINLIGTFAVLSQAAWQMSQLDPLDGGERGVIVNTASVAAFDGQIGQAAYAASKGGVVGMTLPVARDLASMGIRVCTIAPGLFNTPLLQGLPDEAKASLGAQVPFPSRLGEPDEYAQLAMQIVENPMLNGETIRLDGAIRMAPK